MTETTQKVETTKKAEPVFHCVECGRVCAASRWLCTRCYVNNKL